jgi:hypothetical protein
VTTSDAAEATIRRQEPEKKSGEKLELGSG